MRGGAFISSRKRISACGGLPLIRIQSAPDICISAQTGTLLHAFPSLISMSLIETSMDEKKVYSGIMEANRQLQAAIHI